jgi:photosynthetic reaction center cytochrome c subunit
MLPKWFDKWNADNPTNIYGPAILIGAIGAAVFVVALLVTWGQPFATTSLQTGPRGTGMSVPEFKSDLAAGDPTAAGYLARSGITEADTAAVSEAALSNVPPALEGISPEAYAEMIVAMRSWTGIPDLMEDPENYQTQVAYRMVAMVQSLNDEWGGHTNVSGEAGVNCYTCHRGQAVPNNIWFRIAPVNENTAGWASVQNRVPPQSQYTSLPSDALESYLLDTQSIKVHDLDSRVDTQPGDPTWQNAERTFSLMNYFANSLGVNCVFCHNTRAFYDPAQVTPQWSTASLGIIMVQDLNTLHLVPLAEEGILPENRLGPVYADAPKAACATCHKGYQKPLGGMDMVSDWPELALVEPDFTAATN